MGFSIDACLQACARHFNRDETRDSARQMSSSSTRTMTSSAMASQPVTAICCKWLSEQSAFCGAWYDLRVVTSVNLALEPLE